MIRRPPTSTLFPTRRSSDLDRGYFYDAAWNLNRRTNNGVSSTFSVNSLDRKSTRLNSSHSQISYAVFCLKKKKDYESPLHTPHACHNRKTRAAHRYRRDCG